MSIQFWKLEAAGNDFIMIDNRSGFFDPFNQKLIEALCHRRFGIGADGLISVTRPSGYDLEMKYFNSDGSGPFMCGNGARAAVLFAKNRGFFREKQIRFLASDGEHFGDLSEPMIRLTIKAPNGLRKLEEKETVYYINTGTDHLVIPTKGLRELDISKSGPYYRHKYNTNVNYIEQIQDNRWQIRTWERGVENETYACGTGATAAAYFITTISGVEYPVILQAKGGELVIDFKENKLWLQGPAREVFEGRFIL
ncbi:MAG: diaminopimelate epimerase [Candidatus Marinimicrobia bacterium]|nr:diaminopimelate epimerase [Candidatus Neomarinimicrobiota bacterium]